jgi:hypothetical protein
LSADIFARSGCRRTPGRGRISSLGQVERQDLRVVLAVLDGPRRADVTLIGEVVQLVAGQLPFIRHHLRALPLVDEFMPDVGELGGVVGAKGLVGHHLGAAGDDDVHITGKDGLRREVDRLLAGPAHAVERHPRHLHREAGLEQRQPGEIGALVANGSHHAPYHVLHPGGLDPRPPHGLLQDKRGQLNGMEGIQRAAGLALRGVGRTPHTYSRAHSGDNEDIGIGHVAHPFGCF